MNRFRALAFASGALTASLATTPAALAWPSCDHAAVSGDRSSRSEAQLQRLIREHLMLRHDFATDRRSAQGDADEVNRRGNQTVDRPTRGREGLVLPEQPRWRM